MCFGKFLGVTYLLVMSKSLQIQTMVVGQILKWGEKWFSRSGNNRGSKRGHEEDQEVHYIPLFHVLWDVNYNDHLGADLRKGILGNTLW